MANNKDQPELPEIDMSELDDQHFKTYMSKSMKAAVRRFARREGLTDSEAGRVLILVAFQSPGVFGGYRPINTSKNSAEA